MSRDRLELDKEDIQSLLDILELKTFDYVHTNENGIYFKGMLDGIEEARELVKRFFDNKLNKQKTNGKEVKK